MIIQISQKLEIKKPRKDVANYAFETDNDPLWLNNVIESWLLTERPIGIGTKIRRSGKFFGKKVQQILEVIEYEPFYKMTFISNHPYPVKITIKLEDGNDNKTITQLKIENTTKMPYSIADFLLAPQLKKNIYKSLKRLKFILEENLI